VSDEYGLEIGFGRFLESVALLIGNGDVVLVAAVSSMRSTERDEDEDGLLLRCNGTKRLGGFGGRGWAAGPTGLDFPFFIPFLFPFSILCFIF
jgi:hypothetical protein